VREHACRYEPRLIAVRKKSIFAKQMKTWSQLF
jgi:hypothetical protein